MPTSDIGLNTKDLITVNCIVAGSNKKGLPDVYFVKVKCTKEQFEDGEHYDAAYDAAAAEGWDPCMCFAEKDPGFKYFVTDWGKAKLTHVKDNHV